MLSDSIAEAAESRTQAPKGPLVFQHRLRQQGATPVKNRVNQRLVRTPHDLVRAIQRALLGGDARDAGRLVTDFFRQLDDLPALVRVEHVEHRVRPVHVELRNVHSSRRLLRGANVDVRPGAVVVLVGVEIQRKDVAVLAAQRGDCDETIITTAIVFIAVACAGDSPSRVVSVELLSHCLRAVMC